MYPTNERLKKERVAEIVLMAVIIDNDQKTADRHGIAASTVKAYKKRLLTDPELYAIYQEKKAERYAGWYQELIGPVLLNWPDFIERAFREADPQNPEAIRALKELLESVAEIDFTGKMIHARLGPIGQGGSQGGSPGTESPSPRSPEAEDQPILLLSE